jgi:hypothetical protein
MSFAGFDENIAKNIMINFFSAVQNKNLHKLNSLILTKNKKEILKAYDISFKTLNTKYNSIKITKIINEKNFGIIFTNTSTTVENPFTKEKYNSIMDYVFIVNSINDKWYISRILTKDDFDRLIKYSYLKKYMKATYLSNNVTEEHINEKWYKEWEIITNNYDTIDGSNEKFGWKPVIKKIGKANPPLGGQGGALYLYPISKKIPAQIKKVIFVNKKNEFLKLKIAGNINGDFLLQIKINGKKKYSQTIDGKNWKEIKIPLNSFYGTYADIDIYIISDNCYFPYAFIDEITIE